MWQGRRVILGVTGGIATYKVVALARELAVQGAAVDVILTRGAREFVGAVTFEAVTRRPVRSSIWERDGALDHVTLAREADLIIVAPATANLLARAAAGAADDLLTALLLAASKPVLLAPAMNDDMFANAATEANLALVAARGWHVVGPATGALAEGPSDRPGRMVEPREIIAHAERLLQRGGTLDGKRVVVTAGPTREAIDPVRVITNRSSGKMGYRLAEAAWRRGAVVTLISGPSAEVAPVGVDVVRVDRTAEMSAAVSAALPRSDVLIMAAAPADYRAGTVADSKLPRSGGLDLSLQPTDDILLSTRAARPAGLTVVGFALETGDAVTKARQKLERKSLDLIVVNDATDPHAGFEVDTNVVTILDRRGGEQQVSQRSKAAVADAILNAIEVYRG
ncbi:MAG TPA: bifunctional phosphopantothenoylcysteine decarboxylase/phosphopantothenate--cysteine ligase CoaBC [Gemmatimonadales bacterium]|jgi:phosphopantothenoylcysteine decarboxylase/phosphopantothenate--cysteine ligase|nr:bifunctional phosphopantothenoylcysteine decarboxylase/phosphopantothenate--cysteine ligase CoaBC [Gemmatimonadales bacterium]